MYRHIIESMTESKVMQQIWAETALTREGWQHDVLVSVDSSGVIASVEAGSQPYGTRTGILLPAPVNLHSHAFQRAMAGLTERRGDDPSDSFWTWRKLMYRFLDHLTPEHVEAITGFVQMEMLEAGYAAVAEFHYLHHRPGGIPYDDLAELSGRISAAAATSGIGLTLLPVLYEHGGCDGRALGSGQIRFGNDPDRFGKLWQGAAASLKGLPRDTGIGVAPHSLRAVSQQGLRFAEALAADAPIHMHLAEQVAEVEEVEAAWGKRPADWLMSAHNIEARWCLIHCTQMTPDETVRLARTGAVAGLCPITESSLGDGIFDGLRYVSARGRFGVGSDSNIRISLAEELRTLEYSQRLRDRGRAMLATPEKSTGRVLLEGACAGGAQAAGRACGTIAPGMYADLLTLDAGHTDLAGRSGDTLLDSFIFAGDSSMVRDVWAAGRHVVKEGRHVSRDAITSAYRKTIAQLMDII
jgi:formimidoylglutamate deiminase